MTQINRVLALAVLSIAVLVGCGPATLSKSAVETGAMAALTASVGMQSPQVTCPGDMPATVGATQTCTMPLSGGTYNVVVTITAVNDGVASFSAAVASMPNP